MSQASEEADVVLLRTLLTEWELRDVSFLLCERAESWLAAGSAEELVLAAQQSGGCWRQRLRAALLAANRPLVARLLGDGGDGGDGWQPSALSLLLFRSAGEFADSEAAEVAELLGLRAPVGGFSDVLCVMAEAARHADVVVRLRRLGDHVATDNGAGGDNSLAAAQVPQVQQQPMYSEMQPQQQQQQQQPEQQDTYSLQKRLCVIMNVKSVKGHEERLGSEQDVHRLVEIFQNRWRYTVLQYHDVNQRQYVNVITEVKRQAKEHDMLIFFAMSHGDDGHLLLADGNPVSLKDQLVNPFLDRGLLKKPKVFVFQCCRGSQVQSAVQLQYDSIDLRYTDLSDLYVFHSTFEGFRSARVPGSGSWFLQELCNVLLEEESREIDEVRRLVMRRIMERMGDLEGHQVTQTPCVDKNSLTRRLYLRPGAP